MELIDQIKALYAESMTDLKALIAKHAEEVKLVGVASEATKLELKSLADKILPLQDRIMKLEQRNSQAPASGSAPQSVGQRFTSNEAVRAASARGDRFISGINVGNFYAANPITGDTGNSDGPSIALTAETMPLFTDPKRALRIRDLLTVLGTTKTSIEFIRYTFTSNAAPVYQAPSPSSPLNPVFENVTKPQSDMTFSLDSEVVRTIAHWVAASKQILSDLPELQGIIDTELRYGLMLVEDEQLLTGDGTQANLNGLITQATAYDGIYNVSGDTIIDRIRRAMLQAWIALYPPTAVVVNPVDWALMETLKDANENYLIGNPQGTTQPSVWGLPLVQTVAINSGYFLVGAFNTARLYDRQQTTIDIAEQHDDYFTRNMVAIRAEERLALVVPRPQAFIYGPLAAVA